MSPNVIRVKALDDYSLLIEFENGEIKKFEVTPFLDKGRFQELREKSMFKTVKVNDGAVEWANTLDLSSDTLYFLSKSIK